MFTCVCVCLYVYVYLCTFWSFRFILVALNNYNDRTNPILWYCTFYKNGNLLFMGSRDVLKNVEVHLNVNRFFLSNKILSNIRFLKVFLGVLCFESSLTLVLLLLFPQVIVLILGIMRPSHSRSPFLSRNLTCFGLFIVFFVRDHLRVWRFYFSFVHFASISFCSLPLLFLHESKCNL